MACELCDDAGGEVLWQDAHLRIVAVDDADHPGFCRVIWRTHVGEMTDLSATDRDHLMRAVWATESAIRACCRPDKINLASLGNLVPHLHWHVIPRWRDDRQFPQSIWSPAQQAGRVRPDDSIHLRRALTRTLADAGLTPA